MAIKIAVAFSLVALGFGLAHVVNEATAAPMARLVTGTLHVFVPMERA